MNQNVALRTFRVYTLISAILTKSGLANGETVLKISIEKVVGPRALQSGTGQVFFSPSKTLSFCIHSNSHEILALWVNQF